VRSAREKSRNANQRWDVALASAIETVDRWSSLLRHKAVEACKALQGEETLDWDIPSIAEATGFDSRRVTVCSVTILRLFSEEPPVQKGRGVHVDLYADFDLSPAIREIDACNSASEAGVSDESGLVNGNEPDDERIGRIELETCVANTSKGDRRRGMAPVPKIVVRTTSVRYGDYGQVLEENNYRQKSYNDPTKAFNAFLELIMEMAILNQSEIQFLED